MLHCTALLHILDKFGVGQKCVRDRAEVWNTYMYLSLGRGRKSGGARATGATPSLASLKMLQIKS